MQQILTYVECNDMYTPLRQIVNKRRLAATGSSACQDHSAYREILFLAFMHFGRDNMDHGKYYYHYKQIVCLGLREGQGVILTNQ